MDKKKIRRMRLKMNLSQEQLAGFLGVSVRTLQGWENGRKPNPAAVRLLIWFGKTLT
jgi:putative transcriptional regulator